MQSLSIHYSAECGTKNPVTQRIKPVCCDASTMLAYTNTHVLILNAFMVMSINWSKHPEYPLYIVSTYWTYFELQYLKYF